VPGNKRGTGVGNPNSSHLLVVDSGGYRFVVSEPPYFSPPNTVNNVQKKLENVKMAGQ
jgi:hypothetical protein